MNLMVIPPGRSLIQEVLACLKGKDKDYSSSLVVFPGRRPSHFLRKELAAEIGSSFIPPNILSMDEFVDFICEKFPAGRKIETIDAVALLYDIHKKSPAPLGGRGFMTPDNFFSLGMKIYRDVEELYIEEIHPRTVGEVETLIADGLPSQTTARLQSLSFFYKRFFDKVQELGLSSRSMRYQIAAGGVDESGLDRYGKVIIAGFFALTASEKTLFRKLLLRDNTVFIFQDGPGLKEELKGLGAFHEGEDNATTGPEVHFYESPDTHGQVMALGNILETEIKAGSLPDEKTVIVLPSSATLFPLLHQGLSNIPEDTYNVSLGYPLHRTPVFGFLNNLMELVASMDENRIYARDYLKFVLHPYTKNIYYRGRAETTRILFHSLEEDILRHKTKTFVTLEEIEENKTLFRDVIKKIPEEEEGITEQALREHLKVIHENTIRKFFSFEDVGDFARKCMDVLVFVFNGSTARLHPLFHPFAESLVTSLDILMRSLMKDVAFANRSGYFIFFRKYVMNCRTPFAGTPLKGLQVLGFLETRNLRFDKVFVLDANEDILPDTGREETLLPFKVREILGLPTYRDRDKLTSYYFDSLLRGAGEVHIFFIKNNKTEYSRFVEKLLWKRQKRDKETSPIPYIRPVQYGVNLINRVPPPVSKTGDMTAFLRDYHYTATTLNQYLKCPLQFYYGRVLGLSPKDEIRGDIRRDDLGTFVHNIMRLYFLSRKGRPLMEKDLSVRQMDSLVEDLFEREYGKDLAGALYLLKKQVKKRMADILTYYYIPLLRKRVLIISGIEESLKVKVGGFHLRGRLDSIEQRGDTTFIVDFKTGSSEHNLKINLERLDISRRKSWGEAIGSLQLPFYLLLYTEEKQRPIDEFNALFLLLGRSLVSEDMEVRLFDGSSPSEIFLPLKALILRLLGEIIDPDIPFLPPENPKNTCPACDFKYICGTPWVVK